MADEMTENFHFEDSDVLDVVVGTDYIKQNVLHMLRGHQSAEKWSLYRAIVRLADYQRTGMPMVGITTFLERLRKIMPPKESKIADFTDGVMSIHREPIREIARSFANAIEKDLPSDERELEALLWTFGEVLSGEMERRLKHATGIVEEFIKSSCSNPQAPKLVSPEMRMHFELCGTLPPGQHVKGCPCSPDQEIKL